MHGARAEQLARRAHAGVLDRSGIPYIAHVERVALTSPRWARRVAWVHDVVEDTDITLEQVAECLRLSEAEVEALDLLTRPDGMTYRAYIERIASAPGEAGSIARAVKRADARDNLRRSVASAEPGLQKRYARVLRALCTGPA